MVFAPNNLFLADEEKEKAKGTTVSTGPASKHVVKDPRAKKYQTAMDKVLELEKAGKYGQALAQLPKITDYPEKKAEITARANELRAKRGDLDLFGQGVPAGNIEAAEIPMAAVPANTEEEDNPAETADEEDPGSTEETEDGDPGEEEEEEGTRPLTQLELLEK